MNRQQYQQQRQYLTNVWQDTFSYFKKNPEPIPYSTKYDITKFKHKIDIPDGYQCDCVELFFDMKVISYY